VTTPDRDALADVMLAAMVEGVMLVNPQGRVVMANPAARRMLRWPDTAGTIEGRHYLEVVRQPDIVAQFDRALAGTPRPTVEVELENDGRRIYTAQARAMPAERGGGAVLVLHDVTTLKRADMVRRDFVANVSHELRTPLTAIRGYIEALTDGPPPDAAQQRKFLGIIGRHTLRMERLVKDLLRLARLDAGQETLERSLTPIETLLNGVETEMHAALERKQQTIHREIAPDATTVHADPLKLHDVLRNLVENAMHYGPEGSVIDVASLRVDGRLVVTVSDRGPGIPDEDLPRVFERFYRADRSRSTDPGGTGLGLAIVKHLVELHGGHATIGPRAGGGTTAMISLPDPPATA
jgi:signal transduction histidine kinase